MNLPRLVNLLDDFALGGVSRALGIFDSPAVRAVVDASTIAVKADALVAPRLNAEVIVIHFPPNWRRLAFLASLRLRNPKAKIIHVEHSYTRAWEASHVPSRSRFRAMLSMALHMVDKVVCVSHGQAEWLAEAAHIDAGRIEVIYPYSNNPGLGDLALPNFDKAGPLRIGAYGRFHKAKGFDRLIEAWKAGAMPGTELLIGGFGAEEDRLHALAAGVSGITFAGQINNVAGFLANCDIVAIPSRREAFGQVATEAREAGRPIFVSPVDGLPEQVGEAGLVVDFTSDEAIAAAFAALKPSALARMACEGRRTTAGDGVVRQSGWARLLASITSTSPTPSQVALAMAPN